jgi:hypothetical protein
MPQRLNGGSGLVPERRSAHLIKSIPIALKGNRPRHSLNHLYHWGLSIVPVDPAFDEREKASTPASCPSHLDHEHSQELAHPQGG